MSDFRHGGCGVFAPLRGVRRSHHRPVAEPSPLPSAIAAAIDDLCRDLERYHVRQEQRLHLSECIAETDLLIEEAEDLGDAGGTGMPPEWRVRLDGLARRLPAEVAASLDAGGEPCLLVDRLFAVEEKLYRLRLGEWARAFEQGRRTT